MGSYIIRRVLLAALVVWGAVSLMFLMFFVIPGDSTDFIGGGERAVSADVTRNVKAYYGLDKSMPEQYVNYWKKLLTWNLGRSVSTNRPVNELLKDRAANSFRLAFWGVLIEIFFGILIGVVAAVRRYTPIDYISGFIAVAVTGIPVFVLGLLFQYFLGVKTFQWGFPRWARFPVQGLGPDSWFGVIPLGHQWKYVVLPAVTLACVQTGYLTRITRASLLEVLRSDYMRTAKAKGLTNRRVIFRHGLRNSLIPVVTVIGYDLISLFGVAVLTETVFNWPGLGSTIRDFSYTQDVPVVLGLGFAVVVAAAVLALSVDLLYAVLDPRIRLTTEKVR